MKTILMPMSLVFSLVIAQDSDDYYTKDKEKEEPSSFIAQTIRVPCGELGKGTVESFMVLNKKNGKVWIAVLDSIGGMVLKPVPYLHDEKNGRAYSPIETGIIKAANIRYEEEMKKRAKIEALMKNKIKQDSTTTK